MSDPTPIPCANPRCFRYVSHANKTHCCFKCGDRDRDGDPSTAEHTVRCDLRLTTRKSLTAG